MAQRPFVGSTRRIIDEVVTVARPPKCGDATGRTNDVDIHVGARIRLRRTALGLTQEKLADALGLTFQQVQKYEKGANRVGASRLFDLARVLEVPIGYFFDELTAPAPILAAPTHGDMHAMPSFDPSVKRETLELMRAYGNIRDPVVRRRVYDLARALADVTLPAARQR